MARNKVQFQKGLSEAAFEAIYGTEEKCRALVIASRWPNGFECPACGARAYCEVKSRGLFQCNAWRRQTSPTAGTIYASTHLPLRLWFRAMYHLTQSKQGISSIELGRRLGVTQTTAWKIKHKLAQVMMERDATKPLSGRVELDDVYLGGERSGGKRGRGAPGKTTFVAAVETTPEGKPVRLKLRRVASFCNHALSTFAKRSLDPTCEVVSDGLACFGAVASAGCSHQVVKTGSGAAAARTPTFKWVNTALGNIKAAIVGTYRAIDQKHVPRYLAEFEYRYRVHAERLVHKLDTFTDLHRTAQQRMRKLIWNFYADLKVYRANPDKGRRLALRARFDRIFRRRTGFITLDRLLKRLHANKAELLMVLERPEIPLHTNGSENDIRCQVTRRKVSAGTRSDGGRDCRDAFLGLAKTCAKHGLAFWDYLGSRLGVSGQPLIPPLSQLVRCRGQPA